IDGVLEGTLSAAFVDGPLSHPELEGMPFGSATSITLTVVMGLMLLVYWRASHSYTHLEPTRQEVSSRMPSSA
ncbi:hypothetical protein, partial [Enterobacter intestinihominis]